MNLALIFDFDGVLADSEPLANAVLARLVSEAGQATTLDDSLRRYCGKRWADVAAEISANIGGPLPEGFREQLLGETLHAFSLGHEAMPSLTETPGARQFLQDFAHLPHCIASSSAHARLAHCLSILEMNELFAGNVISGDDVVNGKPAPDIFLLAAQRLGVAPEQCVVFEDSIAGVQAGRAAGMTVIGYCGGGHIHAGHMDRLREAGAHWVAGSWDEAARWVEQALGAAR